MEGQQGSVALSASWSAGAGLQHPHPCGRNLLAPLCPPGTQLCLPSRPASLVIFWEQSSCQELLECWGPSARLLFPRQGHSNGAASPQAALPFHCIFSCALRFSSGRTIKCPKFQAYIQKNRNILLFGQPLLSALSFS